MIYNSDNQKGLTYSRVSPQGSNMEAFIIKLCRS